MLLNLGLSMTLVCYLYSDVSIDYVHFEVEVCARVAHYVCCELRNCQFDDLTNRLRLIAEEARSDAPSFGDALGCRPEMLLERAGRHVETFLTIGRIFKTTGS